MPAEVVDRAVGIDLEGKAGLVTGRTFGIEESDEEGF
jgi:hypothetical protein